MDKCEYCEKLATEKRRIYDCDMGCSIEVNVCGECADYLDTENYSKPEPYEER